MRDALADVANTAEALIHLEPGDAVLDIGCNDGTLLASVKTRDVCRIGFDPAQNLASSARAASDVFINDFFSSDSYFGEPEIADRRPKLVTSIAMFYDLEDPKKFVQDVKNIMAPDGLWVVQMAYLPMMLRSNEVGNVCHEHLEYYSLQSFTYLLDLFDLEVVDVELNDINGGSLRAYIRNAAADNDAFGDPTYRSLATARVNDMREEEARLGLHQTGPYTDFAFWVTRIKRDVVSFVKEQVDVGRKVYVYGASTKGNTVLQYFGLDRTLITAAADRNPEKWGLETVGSRIPIVSEQQAREANPDFFLVLPWHFLAEFQAREKAYLLQGGRFILPMPRFALI